jgi:hypothetical protein
MSVLAEQFIDTMMRAEACYVNEVLVSYPRTCLTVEKYAETDKLDGTEVVLELEQLTGCVEIFCVKLVKSDLESLAFLKDTKEYVVKSGDNTFNFMFLELRVIHH